MPFDIVLVTGDAAATAGNPFAFAPGETFALAARHRVAFDIVVAGDPSATAGDAFALAAGHAFAPAAGHRVALDIVVGVLDRRTEAFTLRHLAPVSGLLFGLLFAHPGLVVHCRHLCSRITLVGGRDAQTTLEGCGRASAMRPRS